MTGFTPIKLKMTTYTSSIIITPVYNAAIKPSILTTDWIPFEIIVLLTRATTPYGINLITFVKTEFTVTRNESKKVTNGATSVGFFTFKKRIALANIAAIITTDTILPLFPITLIILLGIKFKKNSGKLCDAILFINSVFCSVKSPAKLVAFKLNNLTTKIPTIAEIAVVLSNVINVRPVKLLIRSPCTSTTTLIMDRNTTGIASN